MNFSIHFTSLKKVKFLEIFFLFIVAPVVLLMPISIIIKVTYVVLCLVYITLISVNKEKFSKVKSDKKSIKKALLEIGFRFIIIAVLTALVLSYQAKEQLFTVVINKPDIWLKFSGIYIVFSVIPQELIYRTFFVKRYQQLFKNKLVFILINSVLFSFAHIWFQSFTVLAFTFVGSLLFTTTYLKTKSTWLVILEHSIYGVWLYTVGYGALFLFPV